MADQHEIFKVEVEVSEDSASLNNRLGKEFSRHCTWLTGNSLRPYVTLTSTTFTEGLLVDRDGRETGEEARGKHEGLPVYQGINEDDFPKDQLFLKLFETSCHQWTWHTDPEDASGSEIDSDYDYEGVGQIYQHTLAASQEYCRKHLARLDYFDSYYPEGA